MALHVSDRTIIDNGRQPLHWYAVYTRSRYEKKTASYFQEQGIEAWAPTQKTLRQWSDRKKWVEAPLFNSYIFVHTISQLVRQQVSQTEGAVYVVSFQGIPAIIPDEQINSLHALLDTSENFEVSADVFSCGHHVEVVRGALMGMKGIIVEHKGHKRVMMRIDAVNQSLLIDINPAHIKRLPVEEMAGGMNTFCSI